MLFSTSISLFDSIGGVTFEMAADIGVKAALLLAMTAILAFLLRKSSAAVRHRLWSLCFCGVILLPGLSLALPQWRLPVLPTQTVESSPPVAAVDLEAQPANSAFAASPVRHDNALSNDAMAYELPRPVEAALIGAETSPLVEMPGNRLKSQPALAEADAISAPHAATHADWPTWLTAGWLMGLTLMISPLIVGLFANWRMRRRSNRLHDSRWTSLVNEFANRLGLTRAVTLLETYLPVLPMTWGVMRPVILLPRESNNWSDERRRVVLLHELAHVKRLDVMFQLIARIACALYWFNPLVWYALHRLRIERELACDDCVVAAGERASDYASQLLQIVRAYRPLLLPVGVSMARSSMVEQRIVAMLDRARSHLPMNKHFASGLSALVAVVVLTLSAIGLGERAATVSADAKETTVKTADANEANAQTAGSPTADKAHSVRGRVVDPQGRPVKGAKIRAILTSVEYISWVNRHKLVAETATGRDGRFEIAIPAYEERSLSQLSSLDWSTTLLATAKGFGPDWWTPGAKDAGDDVKLTLVKDSVPLQGRVLDLEGRPIRGVKVRVRAITAAATDIGKWIAKARNNPTNIPNYLLFGTMRSKLMQKIARFPHGKSIRIEGLPIFKDAITGSDGRFQINGLGPDRYIALELEGSGIAKNWVNAVTREMQPVPEPGFSNDPRMRTRLCFGSKFDYSAEPTQIIEGVVRDLKSKKPIVGVYVGVQQFAGSLLAINGFANSITDEKGRYRIVGLPKPSDGQRPIRIRVMPGAEDSYFRTEVNVPKARGFEPVKFDIELKRTAWVTGRVIDRKTGEPVQAHVSYYPMIDNPHAPEYSNFRPTVTSVGHGNRYRAAEDGTYRIPAIAGRGVVMAIGFKAGDYQVGAGAEELDWRSGERKRVVYHAYGPGLCNTLGVVDIDPKKGEGECNIALIPLGSQTIHLRDPKNQPIRKVKVVGRRPASFVFNGGSYSNAKAAVGDAIVVRGLDMDGRRLMLFGHPERKLGKAVIVESGKTDTVVLEAFATITGRLVNAKGKPLPNMSLMVVIPKSQSPEPKGKRGWGRRDQYLASANTVENGRFRSTIILPGVQYEIRINQKTVAKTPVVQPGQTIDLGDVKYETDDDEVSATNANANAIKTTAKANAAQTTKTAVTNTSQNKKIQFRGRVLGPDGKPVAGAKIYASYPFGKEWKELASSDNDGRVSFVSTKKVPQSANEIANRSIRLAVVAEGFGFNWLDVKRSELNDRDLVFRLLDDVPIKGRILDAEGQALAGVTIKIRTICQPTKRTLDQYIQLARSDNAMFRRWRDNWWTRTPPGMKPVQTDEQGRFRIAGLGAGRLVEIDLSGENVHNWDIVVATRKDPGGDAKATGNGAIHLAQPPYKSHYYAKFAHVSEPNRKLRGIVRDKETGKPVAGVLVRASFSSSRQMRTDETGRFELFGLRKQRRHRIEALPQDPGYFRSERYIPDGGGIGPLDVTIDLVRGITVRGKVTDKQTGKPVKGTVEYYPLFPNNAIRRLGSSVPLPCSMSEIKPDGSYLLQALPGPGAIGVRNDDKQYSLPKIDLKRVDEILGSAQIDGNTTEFLQTAAGGQARGTISLAQFKALELIQPEDGDQTIEQNLFLVPGHEISGTIVGPNGETVKNVQSFGLLSNGSSRSEITNGRFTLQAVVAGPSRWLTFYHRAKRLGAMIEISADHQGELKVQLQPGGSVHGRLVDKDGDPLQNVAIELNQSKPTLLFGMKIWTALTAKDGRFKVDGLIPGLEYFAKVSGRRGIAFRVKVDSKQDRDLGDVKVDPLR